MYFLQFIASLKKCEIGSAIQGTRVPRGGRPDFAELETKGRRGVGGKFRCLATKFPVVLLDTGFSVHQQYRKQLSEPWISVEIVCIGAGGARAGGKSSHT